MLVSHGAVIMVVDGAKMSLFRNRGKDFVADLEMIEETKHHVGPTSALGTDKPGRSFSSSGHGRSAHESTDFHQVEEDDFAAGAVGKLNAMAQQSSLDFIIVAAPHVLGVMRKQYSAALRKGLRAEIAKDYAGRSAKDVADLLRNHEA
jgi:protein required for attachment to host cells